MEKEKGDGPKVSVILPTYNYGRYLKKAIDSVLSQTLQDFEVIIIDDGSTDNTSDVLKEYEGNKKIKIIRQKNQGLIISCDNAIKASNGRYIIRLDADDYFDENALLVLSSVLDKNPETALVYPDYFIINSEGKIIDYVRCPKLDEEVKFMDMPPNGACAMFRRKCYDAIGGYNKNVTCQDGYDLWIKMTKSYKVKNINLSLFYYRKHGQNLTTNMKKLLDGRRKVKDDFVKKEFGGNIPKVLGIIPTRGGIATRDLAGKPLLTYTIEEAIKTKEIDRLVVVTEDKGVAKTAENAGVRVIMRPERLAGHDVGIEPTVMHTLSELKEEGYVPEIVVLLHVDSPFKKSANIREAIDTLLIYNADSVISVCEDMKFHYQHGKYGLKPLFEKRLLRTEKESLYEENGAIYISKKDAVTKEDFLGKRLSHIIMTPEESVHIDSEFGFWLAEQVAKSDRNA